MFSKNGISQIKALSGKMEESKTILPEVLGILYEYKLFKIFSPKALGGLELSLVEGLKKFQEVGAVDGNVGWAVTIGTGGNMFLPLFEQHICKERFLHKEAVIAGSGKCGVAERVNGGYLINGQWKYCSGSDYATIFTMNCMVQGSGEIVTCSVPRETVKVIPDWNAFGLRATSSHSIRVENVFVKDEETFKFDKFQNEYELPVHSFPFASFSECSFFALCVGLTEQFMSEADTALERKKEGLPIERYQFVREQWSQQHVKLLHIEQQFYDLVMTLWNKHINREALIANDLERLTLFCKMRSGELLQSAHMLIRYFGMEGVLENTALNRAWRNLCTASQHSFLTP